MASLIGKVLRRAVAVRHPPAATNTAVPAAAIANGAVGLVIVRRTRGRWRRTRAIQARAWRVAYPRDARLRWPRRRRSRNGMRHPNLLAALLPDRLAEQHAHCRGARAIRSELLVGRMQGASHELEVSLPSIDLGRDYRLLCSHRYGEASWTMFG